MVHRNSTKISTHPEPEIRFSSNSWDIIPIFTTVATDYSSYNCETDELIFPKTQVDDVSIFGLMDLNKAVRSFR